jgi:hypothetical protein
VDTSILRLYGRFKVGWPDGYLGQFQRIGRLRDERHSVVEVVLPLACESPTSGRKINGELVLLERQAPIAAPLVPNGPNLQQAQVGDANFPAEAAGQRSVWQQLLEKHCHVRQ